MTKRLESCTFIDGKHCLTETNYKNHKIYKVYSRGLEYYSVLKDGKLEGYFLKLKDAKESINTL